MASRPPVVRRPDGRRYRPGSIRACLWRDVVGGVEHFGYFVLGAHDAEMAREVAAAAAAVDFRDWPHRQVTAARTGLWTRTEFGRAGHRWVEDPVRGAAAGEGGRGGPGSGCGEGGANR